MTAPTAEAPASGIPVERATALADRLLASHDHRADRSPATARAFGRALAATLPGTGHGQLLAAALRHAKWTDRTREQQIVLQMARRGETPTERAVACHLREREEAEQRRAATGAITAEIVGMDGPRAADYVRVVLDGTGTGPTWTELALAMGWPRRPWDLKGTVITRLAADGWLRIGDEPRSLRPGPKATGDGTR